MADVLLTEREARDGFAEVVGRALDETDMGVIRQMYALDVTSTLPEKIMLYARHAAGLEEAKRR